MHFYKGRVYTFAQKCRGLHPRVSGVAPESVGGCTEKGLSLSGRESPMAGAGGDGPVGGCRGRDRLRALSDCHHQPKIACILRRDMG